MCAHEPPDPHRRPGDAPAAPRPGPGPRVSAPTRGLIGVGVGVAVAYLALRWLTPVVFAAAIGAGIYYLLNPIVAFGARHRIPRTLGASGVYLTGAGALAGLAAWIGPRLYGQLQGLAQAAPEHAQRLGERIADSPLGRRIGAQQLDDLTGAVAEHADVIAERALGHGVGWMMSALSATFTGIVGLTLGYYLLISGPKLAGAIPAWLPPASRERWVRFGRRASAALANYLRSRLAASGLIGVAYALAFWVAGIEHALILGVIGAVMNMLPIIGPFIAAAPAIALASAQGLGAVIAVVVIMVVAQQVENHLLSPLLDGRMVRLSPVIVLIGVAVGAALFGLVGVLLATPMAAVLVAALDVFYRERLEDDAGPPAPAPACEGGS